MESNDGKSAVVYRRRTDARRYIGQRLDRRTECHCHLCSNSVYATEGGNTDGGSIQFPRRFRNDADQQ